MENFYNKSQLKYLLVTVCQENIIKITHFNPDHVPVVLYSIKNNQKINVYPFKHYLLINNAKGYIHIFRSNSNLQVLSNCNEEGNQHEENILSVDFFHNKKAFITAAADNKIKIWTFRKNLLIVISIDDKLEGIYTINQNHDLLMLHSGIVSVIKYEQYELEDEKIIKANRANQPNRIQIGLEDIFTY